jgi:hypothetical protein
MSTGASVGQGSPTSLASTAVTVTESRDSDGVGAALVAGGALSSPLALPNEAGELFEMSVSPHAPTTATAATTTAPIDNLCRTPTNCRRLPRSAGFGWTGAHALDDTRRSDRGIATELCSARLGPWCGAIPPMNDGILGAEVCALLRPGAPNLRRSRSHCGPRARRHTNRHPPSGQADAITRRRRLLLLTGELGSDWSGPHHRGRRREPGSSGALRS